ncbi:hypothetical protein WJX72_003813 [[Myrmecia] bisecta]|uniref:GDP-Man:Man(3)GlcNAc(2)-PP-Dol alpha-1,2-mannosyltransferase n=1 Tax=[Myrmecia] bisecta TaxID=41462 RepID=A0AAW1PTF0_9CHLO
MRPNWEERGDAGWPAASLLPWVDAAKRWLANTFWLSLVAPAVILFLPLPLLGPGVLVLWPVLALSGLAVFLAVRTYVKRALSQPLQGTVGFFHPNADGGGGGERVLWCAVAAIQQADPNLQIIIYSGEKLSAVDLAQHTGAKFNLQVQPTFQVVHLKNVGLLDPLRYPRFTLIGQAVGSVRLAYQALSTVVPEVFVDSCGWAFVYPLARMAGCKVVAYVHYPTVSTDMLRRVRDRSAAFNNNQQVAASAAKSLVKLVYYYVFAWLYGMAGGFANAVMVNSSWTQAHIRQLWWRIPPPRRVFPPCDTTALQALPLDRKLKRLYLVSVAQFRPEKNQQLQLRAFALARRQAQSHPTDASEAVLAARLVLVGGCRDAGEEARLQELRALCVALGIQDHVDFVTNASFQQLRELLAGAVGGLHTMLDEHFGISIVEYMAAGVVPIAHDSGGPRMDIVKAEVGPSGVQVTGYRCSTQEAYADAIAEVLSMGQVSRLKIAAAARRRAAQFSDERFQQGFLESLQLILPSHSLLTSDNYSDWVQVQRANGGHPRSPTATDLAS